MPRNCVELSFIFAQPATHFLRTRCPICWIALAIALATNGQQALATVGFNSASVGYTYQLNSSNGPTLGNSQQFAATFLGTTFSDSFTSIGAGTGAGSAASYSWDLDFDTLNPAAVGEVTFSSTTNASASADPPLLAGVSGANAEIETNFVLGVSVATSQFYRIQFTSSGLATESHAALIANSLGFASNSSRVFVSQGPDLNYAMQTDTSLVPNRSTQDTVYGYFGAPSIYSFSVTTVSGSNAGGIVGFGGLANSNSGSGVQIGFYDLAPSLSTAELASYGVRFFSGTYSMPVLSQADSVNIAVDHADLIVAPGSVLAGSLTIDGVGTLHIDSNLGLTSNGIVAVGAGGGIVAVGAGAGIVASGAGGGIVAVGAGGGIISSGGGGQIIAAGAGGMIIASGAGGQIVGNNGNAIVASGAGGGLFGNGEFGNPSLSVALSLDAASQLSIGHSPGSLTVHGSVSLAPTSYSRFEIGGLLREAEYDALDVVQVAGLGGTINLGGSALLVELYDGFESDPALANASFDLIETEGPINGAFSNLSSGRIATADGLGTFSISIGAHAVTLSNFLAATLPGDFNADSVVDARDYVVWRNQLHTAYSHSAYETWRAHFGAVGNGSSSGAVAVVPEPVSLILPLMLLIAITGIRRCALA